MNEKQVKVSVCACCCLSPWRQCMVSFLTLVLFSAVSLPSQRLRDRELPLQAINIAWQSRSH